MNNYLLLSLQPEWKLADPVCTFLFSILVMISAINLLRDSLRVLMEDKVEEKGGKEGEREEGGGREQCGTFEALLPLLFPYILHNLLRNS